MRRSLLQENEMTLTDHGLFIVFYLDLRYT